MDNDRKPVRPRYWSFWADAADLSVLSPEHRLRSILYLFAGICVIAILWLVPNWTSIGVEEMIVHAIGIGFLIVIFPALLAIEMFFKGSRAGEALRLDADNAKEKLSKAERELEENSPNLRGKIDRTACGCVSMPNGEFPTATLLVSVRNTGEPSIAENYRVSATLPNGIKIEGELHRLVNLPLYAEDRQSPLIPGPPPPPPSMVLSEKDAIYNKTFMPIERGGMRRGWLLAVFPNNPQVEIGEIGTTFHLEFIDILERKHHCSHTIADHGVPISQADWLPGDTAVRNL